VASGLLFSLFTSIIIGVLFYNSSPFLLRGIGVSGAQLETVQDCFKIAVVGYSINLFTNGLVGISRGLQEVIVVNLSTLISTTLGLVVTTYLLFAGFGLWSITWGILIRAILHLVGCILFALIRLEANVKNNISIDKTVILEILRTIPVSATGSISYALMNQSENFVAAHLLSPNTALILSTTRRGCDLIRIFLDTITSATYGPLSHLISTCDKNKVCGALNNIEYFRFVFSTSAVFSYIGINKKLVETWVGQEHYGGNILTLLVGWQVIAVANSYFYNSVLRSGGELVKGSGNLITEAVSRLLIVLSTVRLFGIYCLPVATIITSVAFSNIYKKKILLRFGFESNVRSLGIIAGLITVVIFWRGLDYVNLDSLWKVGLSFFGLFGILTFVQLRIYQLQTASLLEYLKSHMKIGA
jgi:O-antigen/teichoic acid export membrane protein